MPGIGSSGPGLGRNLELGATARVPKTFPALALKRSQGPHFVQESAWGRHYPGYAHKLNEGYNDDAAR